MNRTQLRQNVNLIITVRQSPRCLIATTDAQLYHRWDEMILLLLICTLICTHSECEDNILANVQRGREEGLLTPLRRYSLVGACTPSAGLGSAGSRWKHARIQASYHTLQPNKIYYPRKVACVTYKYKWLAIHLFPRFFRSITSRKWKNTICAHGKLAIKQNDLSQRRKQKFDWSTMLWQFLILLDKNVILTLAKSCSYSSWHPDMGGKHLIWQCTIRNQQAEDSSK